MESSSDGNLQEKISPSFSMIYKIKSFLQKFDGEDLILFAILYLLIEEGIEDDFLIITLVLLILTGKD